jgi:hypothetical protein
MQNLKSPKKMESAGSLGWTLRKLKNKIGHVTVDWSICIDEENIYYKGEKSSKGEKRALEPTNGI